MSLIVCSPSTKDFINGEKYIVTGPPTDDILELEGKYNDVIAIGGGAVIDTAKILSSSPIICYPTTASGASATSHSVYWASGNKRNCERFIPKEVKFDIDFIKSLPDHTLLYTRYDAISHCLDVMWSKDYNKLNQKEVEDTLRALVDVDITPIEIIKLGHKAGSFIQQVPTTILHALSYPLTSEYGIPHGKALGFLIFPLCKLFGDSSKILGLKKLDDYLDIDINFIIFKAKQYNKFFNTSKQINLIQLTQNLNDEIINRVSNKI